MSLIPQKSLVKNVNDPEQVRKAEIKTRINNKGHADDLAWLLSDRRGRRILWKWMTEFGTFGQPYMGAGRAEDTAYYCGQMQAGKHIYSEIESVRPDSLALMSKEYEAEQIKNQEHDFRRDPESSFEEI